MDSGYWIKAILTLYFRYQIKISLQSLTGREQSAIVYVDVTSAFGEEYVKHYPDIDKVPSVYNRETGEILRLGYHTDSGIEILDENINKIADDTKH